VKREIGNALRSWICTMYGTVNVSRTSLSVMPKADMKSSGTVTDGSSKELTIEKCASREGKRERRKKGEIRMLMMPFSFFFFLLA